MERRPIQFIGLSLNMLISIFLGLTECFINKISDSIIIDIVLILCGTFFSWIFITKQLGWKKGDISPFFFWILTIKRITLVGLQRSEFVYFLFGFINGIHSSKLEIKDEKRYYWKAKTTLQVILSLGLIIFNFLTNLIQYQTILIIFYAILFILLGVFENIDISHIQSTQEDYNTDQKNTQAELKKCKTIIQQYQSTKSIWEQFNNLTEDWICKIEIIKAPLNRYSWEVKEQSSELQNFLKENKTNLKKLFSCLMIVGQSSNMSQSVQDENNTFQNWFEKNYIQEYSSRKQVNKRQFQDQFEPNQLVQEPSIISPQNNGGFLSPQNNGTFLSPQNEGGFLIQQCQQQDHQPILVNDSNQGSIYKNKVEGYLNLNQINYNLSLTIFLIEDDKCYENKQQSIIVQMKNINHQSKISTLEQQRKIFFNYLSKIASLSSQVYKQISEMKISLQEQLKQFDRIKNSNFSSLSFYEDNPYFKQDKPIGENKQSQQNTPRQNTNLKITSSHSHNHDSQDENFQKISLSYYQQQQEILKQIEKLNFELILMNQNHFNFFELHSQTKLEIEYFNIFISFNIVKEIFQLNPFLNQHNIIITQELNNQTELIIQSDKRKIKQILINIINNSIEKFAFNLKQLKAEKNEIPKTQQILKIQQQELKQQNMIIIKSRNEDDKIVIEVQDNFGGIDEKQLNNRVNNCKFGLATCQKLLRSLAYEPKQPMKIINYENSRTGNKGTVVEFALPKTRDNLQQYEENTLQESLIVCTRKEIF